MSDTDSLREQYNCFIQEIYRNILKKEGFVKAHRAFIKMGNGIIYSVEFTSCFDKDNKKKDMLRFQICVGAQLERETQLCREKKLITGKGAYRRFLPALPRQSYWTGKMKYSEEDIRIIECFQIQKHIDHTKLIETVRQFLDEALRDTMWFQTEDDLMEYLNAKHEENMKALAVGRRRHVLFEFIIYGILGVGVCVIVRDWFCLVFVSIIYYMIVLEDTDLSDLWFRRLLIVPVAELLVMGILGFLLWQKVIDDFTAGKMCIWLFLSGFVHLVNHIYNRHVRKKLKELYNNRRFWGGA